METKKLNTKSPVRQLPLDPENIPEDLKVIPRWICWKAGETKENGKFAKLPINAKTGATSNANDPVNWLSYDEARAVYDAGRSSGIGIVLCDQPIDLGADELHYLIAVDLDGYAPESQLAVDVRTALGGCYQEISPSGKGVRMLVLSKEMVTGGNAGEGRELYSKGRFVTVTGVQGEGALIDATAGCMQIAQQWFGAKRSKNHCPAPSPEVPQLEKPETPERIAEVNEMLQYVSADCIYETWRDVVWAVLSTGWGKAEYIARNWSMTALHRFDERAFDSLVRSFKPNGGITLGTLHYHARKGGYPVQSFQELIKFQNYGGLSTATDFRSHAISSQASGGSAGDTGLLQLSSGKIAVPINPPPPRRYVMSGQITPGTLCVLAGNGGVSKTMLMMQVAVAAAAGVNLGYMEVTAGASLLLLGEEDDAERDRRLGAICTHMHVDTKVVNKRVMCFASAGKDIRLTKNLNGVPEATSLGCEIINCARTHAEESGCVVNLIVIDHARLVLGGDPNDAQEVTQLTRVLTDIAKQTGAAVVLIAHSPKTVLGKEGHEINAADIAGSSAFSDNARAAFMMWGMRDKERKDLGVSEGDRNDYVRLENVKANYARTGGGYWFKRVFLPNWDVAVLEQTNLMSQRIFGPSKAKSALRGRILGELNRKPGGITTRNLRDMAGEKGPLAASERTVRAELNEMKDEGLIVARAPTTAERKKHSLPGQCREVLVAND